ncbi:Starch-binding associating with outer membrane [Bacteroidales bacterium WCE2008]|nr:Starch-binding associating with outer membrane [Bacteroidales bacterium WCE2008]
MKLYKLFTLVAVAGLTVSCGDDFLTTHSTQQGEAGGAATEGAILSYLASSYQPLLLDSYANYNYNAVFLLADMRSDDLYKGGGDASDQGWMYQLSQFNIDAASSPSGLWSIYFAGIARANNTLIACENAVGFDSDVAKAHLAQYKAEALFLRAYYTHLLWKYYGNIPYFTEPLPEPYMAKQLSFDEVYEKIMEDIDAAETLDALEMNTNGGNNQARVSKAALLMLKARVVMYKKDSSKYAEVAADMAEIINSHAFGLMSDFDSIWGNEGEFCKESIFESNQLPTGKGWGNAWGGYGTNLPAFISPNELNDPDGVYKGGWGFGPVRVEAWEMYEDGDVRREGSINDWRNKGSYGARFQNTGLFQKKYAARIGYNDLPGDQDLNYANNLRIFRYAETLLNYAELVAAGTAEQGGVSAQTCLDEIRTRAGVGSIALSTANVKLERRKEFLGEGMRFWDLIRWGEAEAALTENDPANNTTRTFKAGKDEFVPIPQSEMSRTAGTDYALTQNNGY